jgi:hypothetical protein
MSVWLRMGPVKVSSRGRVGVKAGPVSVYGGGSRRRRSRSSSSDGGGAALVALVGIIFVIALIITYWYIAVPVLAVLGILTAMIAKANAEKRAEQAKANAEKRAEQERLLAERQAEEAAARAESQRKWLAGPPPTLLVPARFTDKWFAEHAPYLHPGQVPALMQELHERGWTDDRIDRRVRPYLLKNPYLAAPDSQRALSGEVRSA